MRNLGPARLEIGINDLFMASPVGPLSKQKNTLSWVFQQLCYRCIFGYQKCSLFDWLQPGDSLKSKRYTMIRSILLTAVCLTAGISAAFAQPDEMGSGSYPEMIHRWGIGFQWFVGQMDNGLFDNRPLGPGWSISNPCK